MRATVMYGAGDVRVEDVADARLIDPTDALVRVTRAAICGSDLWPYKSMPHDDAGRRMGHEFIGVVALLPHLERALGSFSGGGFAEPEWNIPFSAFRWPTRQRPESTRLCRSASGATCFKGVDKRSCLPCARHGTKLQHTSS